MNKIFKGFLALSVLTVVMTIASCTKTCDTGFEGTDCKTEIRAKYLGTWTVKDGCTSTGYNNTVSKGSDVLEIKFSNLGNYGTAAQVVAKVNGNAISATSYQDATGRKFTINGSLSGDTLTVNYSVLYADTTTDNCTAKYFSRVP